MLANCFVSHILYALNGDYILLEIRTWAHCDHREMNMVSNKTQVSSGI